MPQGRRRRQQRKTAPARSEETRPRLVIYLPERESVRRLERLVTPVYALVSCDSSQSLEYELSSALSDALILDRLDGKHASTLDLVRRVRERFPSVAIILYCAPEPALFHEMIEFSRAGIHELVLRGADDLRGTLQRTISSAAQSALIRSALAVLEPKVSPQVVAIVRACLAQRDGQLDVESLARELGVTRKTLANWCSASSAPPPLALIGWSRVLNAARLLEDPGRSIEAIASSMHFGSATALTNLMKRYVGKTPSALRRQGPVRCVLDAWLVELDRNRVQGA